jgi:cell division protein ZapA (FtsZ GTPase activity inhibitor)
LYVRAPPTSGVFTLPCILHRQYEGNTTMENRKSPLDKELTDLGYHQPKARRGLVTYMVALLATLLFISVTGNIAQYRIGLDGNKSRGREYKECRDKLDETLLQLLQRKDMQESKVDTAMKLLERIKNLEQ